MVFWLLPPRVKQSLRIYFSPNANAGCGRSWAGVVALIVCPCLLIKAATLLGICLSFQHQEGWMTTSGKQKLNERCLQEPVSDRHWRGTGTAMGRIPKGILGSRFWAISCRLEQNFQCTMKKGDGFLHIQPSVPASGSLVVPLFFPRTLAPRVGVREVISSAERLWAPEVKCVIPWIQMVSHSHTPSHHFPRILLCQSAHYTCKSC